MITEQHDKHYLSGTFAVVSLMTGSVVEQLVPTTPEMNSSSSEEAELEAQRIGVASAVALLSGIIMVKHRTKRLNPKILCISCECSLRNKCLPCAALHVWSPAGLPLHLSLGANRKSVHQRRCLPRYHLSAAKHAGVAAPSPHRNLLPLQSKLMMTQDGP